MRITGVISLYGKQRGPTIMQSSIYFFHNLLHILMLQQLMIFDIKGQLLQSSIDISIG
jgi:hypothetical protein